MFIEVFTEKSKFDKSKVDTLITSAVKTGIAINVDLISQVQLNSILIKNKDYNKITLKNGKEYLISGSQVEKLLIGKV